MQSFFMTTRKKGWSASLRVLYKSRWGTYDKDGNGIINREDEYAKGSALVNINAAKLSMRFVCRRALIIFLIIKMRSIFRASRAFNHTYLSTIHS
jgi:hypothetical protein